jgi:glycosyltransferase involved in cell wall biosynthesis
MKICYIADSDIIITIRYLKYFVKQGHEVYLIPAKVHTFNVEMKGGELDGVNIVNLNLDWRNTNWLKLIFTLKRKLKLISPDLVHIMNISRIGIAASFANRTIPIILTPWGADLLIPEKRTYISKLKMRMFLSRISLQLAGSTLMHLKAVELGLNPKKCHLIDLGIDTKKFKPGLDSSVIRNKLKIPLNKNIVLVPRQWSVKQNTELILRSVPLILDACPNTVFIFKNVVGSLGPLLHKVREELNLNDDVFLIDRDKTPLESYNELPLYYNLADITVSIPTYDAGAPYTVSESMACGSVPMVSPANKVWVKNRKNGLVIIPENKESISAGIIELLKKPEWVKKASFLNHHIIDWGLNFDFVMSEISEIYSQIIIKK